MIKREDTLQWPQPLRMALGYTWLTAQMCHKVFFRTQPWITAMAIWLDLGQWAWTSFLDNHSSIRSWAAWQLNFRLTMRTFRASQKSGCFSSSVPQVHSSHIGWKHKLCSWTSRIAGSNTLSTHTWSSRVFTSLTWSTELAKAFQHICRISGATWIPAPSLPALVVSVFGTSTCQHWTPSAKQGCFKTTSTLMAEVLLLAST